MGIATIKHFVRHKNKKKQLYDSDNKNLKTKKKCKEEEGHYDGGGAIQRDIFGNMSRE